MYNFALPTNKANLKSIEGYLDAGKVKCVEKPFDQPQPQPQPQPLSQSQSQSLNDVD